MQLFDSKLYKFSLVFVLVLFSNSSYSEEVTNKIGANNKYSFDSVNKILKSSDLNAERFEGNENVLESIGDTQQREQKISDAEGEDLRKYKSYDPNFFKTTEEQNSPLWEALYSGGNQQEVFSEKEERYGDVKAFILVSLSMPRTSLERLFAEVSYQYSTEDIIFVFQGWQPPDFSKFNSQINELLPSENPPAIAIDPTIFKKLEVHEVPYFAINTGKAGWKKVSGDVSYFRALEVSESHYDKFTPSGQLYPIAEPNLLDYIYKTLEDTDWNEQIATATEALVKQKTSQVDLSNATSSYQYLVNGSVAFTEDVISEGTDFVKAGEVVNPLEHMVFSSQYAVIDATSQNQLEILRYWKRKHTNVRLLTTILPDGDRRSELTKEFGEIQQIDPLLSKRFGLERVPSLVYQVGHELIVEVIKHNVDTTQLLTPEGVQ